MNKLSTIKYLDSEERPSVVIFENISSFPTESQEIIQDPPLVWVIVAAGREGSKIADISWCKTQLKELINKYVKTNLWLTITKLIWKFTKNPEQDKTRILWYILYKVHTRIIQYDIKSYRSYTVNLV